MYKFVGIILYFVVTVLSVLIKKSAEEKKRSTSLPIEPAQVDLEMMGFEELDEEPEQYFSTESEEVTFESAEEETDYESAEDMALSWAPVSEPRRTLAVRQPNLALAVIMAEIVRTPRAKRPWPVR